MRYIQKVALILLPVVVLALAGCGSSSSGSTSTDPFSGSSAGTGTGTGTGTAAGGGVIMFTSAAGASPGSQINLLEPGIKEVDPAISPAWTFMQLIPFKVTDSNGNARVGVPVTLYVYSITSLTEDVTIDFLVPKTIEGNIIGPNPEPNQQTITTDSAGQGIFNATVTLLTPPPGGVNIVDVVFKAVTNDAIPVTAYVGNAYTLSSKQPTLIITPSAASFGTATDITFTIVGGSSPYSVSSNNTARVTATLDADGVTVLAHLVDTTAWTGSTTISVTDSAGQSTSATVTR